jgi:hypothetical protein
MSDDEGWEGAGKKEEGGLCEGVTTKEIKSIVAIC